MFATIPLPCDRDSPHRQPVELWVLVTLRVLFNGRTSASQADGVPSRSKADIPPQSLSVRFGLLFQSVDATQALNLSAGVSNPSVSRGRSLSRRPI